MMSVGAAIDGKARAKQTAAANLIDEEVIIDFVMLLTVVVIIVGFADATGFDDGTSRGNPERFYRGNSVKDP